MSSSHGPLFLCLYVREAVFRTAGVIRARYEGGFVYVLLEYDLSSQDGNEGGG